MLRVAVAKYVACGSLAIGAVGVAAASCGGSAPSAPEGFEGGLPSADGGGLSTDASSMYDAPSAPREHRRLARRARTSQCQQQACSGGTSTTVTGTVYAPNGTLPLYNVIVYIPNAPLAPVTQGITCDQCGTIASGDPIATTLSDSSGHFTLSNVPVGTNIPIVVQLGKWRRQATIPNVAPCTDTPLKDPNLTRLPKNQKEGSMPHIALTTGGCDSMGCMMGKLGIDPAEFGVQSDGYNKAINVYSSAGDFGSSDGFSNTTQASALWSSLTLLKTYDIGVFSCECAHVEGVSASSIDPIQGTPTSLPASADFAAVTQYLDQGGRIFTTDFQYTWYKYSPDPQLGAALASNLDNTGIGTFVGGAPSGNNPLTLNETFPKGSRWRSGSARSSRPRRS